MNITRELQPIYTSNKSFYKKAHIIYEDNSTALQSYNTIVARVSNETLTVYGTYSNTTLRHIREFMRQNGFMDTSLKTIREKYMN